MGHKHVVFAVCGMLALSCSGAASAQYAVEVFGSGYARRCYDSVKDRELAPKTLGICDIALSQENLSTRNRAATYINRGIVFMRAENYDRAMKDYDRALSLMPDLPEIKINLGAMLYHMGRFREAVDALNVGITAQDTDARAAAFYNRAISHEQLGDFERAYDDYRSAMTIIPGYPPAERQLKRYSVLPG